MCGFKTEGVRQCLVEILNRDTEPASGDLAMCHELIPDLGGDVDRDRERQALVATRAAVDLRVDPDDLALEVEQGAARVARVDGDVGLDEGHVSLVGQRARFGRNDACGDTVLEAERRADCEHPFTDPGLARVAQRHGGQILGVDAQHCDVGRLVDADHLGGEFALVGELDRDLGGVRHHMCIGEDDAVGTDDEARAHAVCDLLTLGHLDLRAEATEEVVERVVRIHPAEGRLSARRGLYRTFDTDVDDSRAITLGDGLEVRQRQRGRWCSGRRSGRRHGRRRR